MLSGAFMAWKAASPLIKYGAIAGLVVALWLAYLAQREYHEWQGRLQAEAKQEKELRIQAQASAEQYAEQVTILRKKVDEVNHENESFRAELATANQEIQRYAKLNKVRRIDNDAIAIVNEFARVLNAATDERVPDAGGAAAEPAVAAKAAPTTLDAFERLEAITAGWGECEIKHRGLSEWILEQYNTGMEFYLKGSPP
jgi:hypothetical protein